MSLITRGFGSNEQVVVTYSEEDARLLNLEDIITTLYESLQYYVKKVDFKQHAILLESSTIDLNEKVTSLETQVEVLQS